MVIILLSFPIVFFITNLILLKTRQLVSLDMKRGFRCYNCKTITEFDHNIIFSKVGEYDTKDFTLCKMCTRDVKINLLKTNLIGIKTRLKKWIVVTSDFHLIKWFSISSFISILFYVLLLIINIDSIPLLIIIGILNFLSGALTTIKTLLITKKPQD
jgi:hypothetical protein